MHALKPLAALALAAHLAACSDLAPGAPTAAVPSAAVPGGANIVGNGGSNLNVPGGGPNLNVPNGGPNLNVPTGGPHLNVPNGGPNVIGPNGGALKEGTRAPGAPAASTTPAADCAGAFAAADADADHLLTAAELAAAGHVAPWAEHDADGGGSLDEGEFCAMTAGE